MEPLGGEIKGAAALPTGAVVPVRRMRHEPLEPSGLIESNGNGNGYGHGYGLDSVTPGAAPFGKLPSFSALWRWKWVILSIFVVIAGPAVPCIWYFIKPEYKATAMVHIDPIMPVILNQTPESGAIPFFRNFLNSQVGLIKSKKVFDEVLNQKEVVETAWYKNKPKSLFGGDAPGDYDRLREDLSVAVQGESNVIVLSMRTEKRQDGKTIVNSVLDHYKKWYEEHAGEGRNKKKDALTAEATLRTEDLNALIAWREDMSKKLGTLDATALRSQLATHLSVLKAELATLQRQHNLTTWRIERITGDGWLTPLARGIERIANERDETDPWRDWLAFLANGVDRLGRNSAAKKGHVGGEVGPATQATDERYYAQDSEWRKLRIDFEDSLHERELAAQRYGESHPRMLDATADIAHREKLLREREAQLQQERDSVVASLAHVPSGSSTTLDLPSLEAIRSEQLEEISLRTREIVEQRTDVTEKGKLADEAARAEDEIRKARSDLEEVQNRLAEISLESKVKATIDTAEAVEPSVPDRDRRIMFTVAAIMGALALGIGVAYLGTMFDPTIREAGDVRHAVQAPFLGQLPQFPTSTNLARDSSPALIEAMRMVRTALFERLRGADERVVLVTSSSPRTGKSTVAMLLARSLALVGKRVLLVEADLHRPSLGGYLQIEAKRGLVSLLAGDASDRDVICRTAVPRLDVVLAGERTAAFDPELLANGVFAACLRRWRGAYDYVVIDSPPVLPVADARILARQADGTVMVLRSSRCRRPDVVQAYADLSAAGGTLLGTVLVGTRQRDGYGYGDGYAYAGYLTNGANADSKA